MSNEITFVASTKAYNPFPFIIISIQSVRLLLAQLRIQILTVISILARLPQSDRQTKLNIVNASIKWILLHPPWWVKPPGCENSRPSSGLSSSTQLSGEIDGLWNYQEGQGRQLNTCASSQSPELYAIRTYFTRLTKQEQLWEHVEHSGN